MLQLVKKGQSAMDLLILTGLLIITVIPLFFWSVTNIDVQRAAQVDDTVAAVKNSVRTLVGLGPSSATQILIIQPKGIVKTTVKGKDVLIDLDGQKFGTSVIFPIQGQIPKDAGKHTLNLKHMGSFIQLYQCGNNIVEASEQCEKSSQCLSGSICNPPDSQNECQCTCIDDTGCPGGSECIDGSCISLTCTSSINCGPGNFCCAGLCQSCIDSDTDNFNRPISPQCNSGQCGVQFDCFDNPNFIPAGTQPSDQPATPDLCPINDPQNQQGINITQFSICRNPAAMEICDTVDNNCDGLIDEGFDSDGDNMYTCPTNCLYAGYSTFQNGGEVNFDPDDNDASINGCVEICADGKDNDGDLFIDENPCATGCTLQSASWSAVTSYPGQQVTATITGMFCDNYDVEFTIWEEDSLSADDYVTTIPSIISGTTASVSWTTVYSPDTDDIGIDPEYIIEGSIVSGTSANVTSSILQVINCNDADSDFFNYTDPNIALSNLTSCGQQDCDDDTSNDPGGCPSQPSSCTNVTVNCAICTNPIAADYCDPPDNNCDGADVPCNVIGGGSCGNQYCEPGEDCSTCPVDCVPNTCGNNCCDPYEGMYQQNQCGPDCGFTCQNVTVGYYCEPWILNS